MTRVLATISAVCSKRSLALALIAFGLLLWARFLLVTGHPRTAIAQPPEASQTVAARHE